MYLVLGIEPFSHLQSKCFIAELHTSPKFPLFFYICQDILPSDTQRNMYSQDYTRNSFTKHIVQYIEPISSPLHSIFKKKNFKLFNMVNQYLLPSTVYQAPLSPNP